MPTLCSPVWHARGVATELCTLCSPYTSGAEATGRIRKAVSESPVPRPSKRGRGSQNEPFILDDDMDDQETCMYPLDPGRFVTPEPAEWILFKQWREHVNFSSEAFSHCSHADSIPLTVVAVSSILKLVSSNGTVVATRKDDKEDVAWQSLSAPRTHQRMGTLYTTLAQLDDLCHVQAFIQLASGLRQPATLLLRVFLRRSVLTEASSTDYYSGTVNHRIQDLTHFLYPPQHEGRMTHDAIRDLYTHVRVPPSTSLDPTPVIQPKGLLPTLLPFQRRSVAWMLSREGVVIDDQGHLSPSTPDQSRSLPVDWEIVQNGENEGPEEFLVHRLLGRICFKTPNAIQRRECSGGILAEEMGLGKTVETMALILLHQRPYAEMTPLLDDKIAHADTTVAETEENDLAKSLSSSHLDDNADRPRRQDTAPKTERLIVDLTAEDNSASETIPLLKSNATLIITPPSILYQWQSELANHAPFLSVYVYEGHEGVTVEDLASHDVVLATYNALGQDIHVARYQERVYRHKRQYTPRKSLFVQIHWWRVCLDEAQMVEISTSKAAEMANLLVRTHSWAISGTPVKKQSEDLHGLLLFLGVEPYASNKKLWRLVVQPSFRSVFLRCFQRIMRRHAKKDVEQELRIPPQRSLAHRIEFTDIERANYLELWDQFLRDVSWPTVENRTADMEVLRGWLLRLRQTCCHPQIGTRNAQVLGGSGELRTITQVLDSMLYQAMSNLNVQERALVTMKINRAVLHARVIKSIDAVPAFDAVHVEIQRQIEKWSKMVIEQRKQMQTAKRVAGALLDRDVSAQGNDNRGELEQEDRGEEEEEEGDEENNLLGDDDGEGGPTNLVRSGRSVTTPEGQLGIKRAILRHWMEQEHRVLFFVAGVYHDLEMEQEETRHYEMAEKVRLQLLSNAERRFLRRKAKIETEVGKQANLGVEYRIEPSEVGHGIVLQSVVERLEDLTKVLNRQLVMMQGWREDLLKRLLQPLMQDGEEGEQYQYSIELQHTLEAYLHYYGRMLLLRKDLLNGTADALATHKSLLKSKREQAEMVARREKRAAASVGDSVIVVPKQGQKSGSGSTMLAGTSSSSSSSSTTTTTRPAETAQQVDKVEQLDKQLEADLDSIVVPEVEQSLRGFRNEIRSLPMRRDMPEIEKKMCELEGQRLWREVERQLALCQWLETETGQFRILTGERTRYYRYLQQISDMVRDVESMEPEVDIQASLESERQVSSAISQMTSKLRYLEHLAETTSRRALGGDEGVGGSSSNSNSNISGTKSRANGESQGGRLAQQEAEGQQGQEASGKVKAVEDEQWCLVCRGSSEYGTLTACGHVFCEECIMAWIAVKAVCPTCMAPIVKRHLTRVYMGTSKMATATKTTAGTTLHEGAGEGSSTTVSGKEEGSGSSLSSATMATHLYGNIQQVPEAIKAMPISTGYGSKVDSISRHIAFLIKENPMVKCIVFSQWQTLLDLLGTSLTLNKIGHVKLMGQQGRKGGRGRAVQQFKDDVDKHVLMLHAKTQSAGLTLLAATHVFICEPLVNPVLQAQAVNRVHRIGQTQETFVHYYLVQDTIEMPVYDLFEQKMAARAGATHHLQQKQDHHDYQEDPSERQSGPQDGAALGMDVDQDGRNNVKNKGKGKARAVSMDLDSSFQSLHDDDQPVSPVGDLLTAAGISRPQSAGSLQDDGDAEEEVQETRRSSSVEESSLTANAAKEMQDRTGELVQDEDVLYCFRAAKEAADLAQRVQTMGMRV